MAAIVLVAAFACGSAPRTAPPRAGLLTTVARARVPRIRVFDEPGASKARMVLTNPDRSGAPLVFVVRNSDNAWLEVQLPVRPNGSLGWISSQ